MQLGWVVRIYTFFCCFPELLAFELWFSGFSKFSQNMHSFLYLVPHPARWPSLWIRESALIFQYLALRKKHVVQHSSRLAVAKLVNIKFCIRNKLTPDNNPPKFNQIGRIFLVFVMCHSNRPVLSAKDEYYLIELELVDRFFSNYYLEQFSGLRTQIRKKIQNRDQPNCGIWLDKILAQSIVDSLVTFS